MGKWFKSYAVFSGTAYKLVLFGLMPLAVAVLWELFWQNTGSAPVLLLSYAAFYEVLADQWLFGGICEKHGTGMEYLKTSFRGQSVFKRALVMDQIRRAVWILALALYGTIRTGAAKETFLAALVTAFVMTAMILILRCFAIGAVMRLWLAFLAQAAALWLYEAGMRMEQLAGVWVILALAVLSAALSVLAVWYAMRRMKGSYEDETGDV